VAFSLCAPLRVRPGPLPELTQEMVDEGMTRTEKVACAPGDRRSYGFPDPLERVMNFLKGGCERTP
jgi:hypothetical protein